MRETTWRMMTIWLKWWGREGNTTRNQNKTTRENMAINISTLRKPRENYIFGSRRKRPRDIFVSSSSNFYSCSWIRSSNAAITTKWAICATKIRKLLRSAILISSNLYLLWPCGWDLNLESSSLSLMLSYIPIFVSNRRLTSLWYNRFSSNSVICPSTIVFENWTLLILKNLCRVIIALWS